LLSVAEQANQHGERYEGNEKDDSSVKGIQLDYMIVILWQSHRIGTDREDTKHLFLGQKAKGKGERESTSSTLAPAVVLNARRLKGRTSETIIFVKRDVTRCSFVS